jgi:SAM-dependent methyltransferase
VVDVAFSDHNFENLEKFPGWEKASGYLKNLILENGCKTVADIGGGAHPMIDMEFIRAHRIDYYVIDISASELAKADPGYKKIELDITCDESLFRAKKIRTDFDLVFSHMMLEHVEDPLKAHANFARLLRPGGLSVHLYPSMNNFPLFVNSLMPEWLSGPLLRLLQPNRKQEGTEGKFVAYYKYCGAPSMRLRRVFHQSGFEIVQHTAYVGHEYYKRIKPLASVERALRKLILALHVPMVSANLLVLKKPRA